MKRQKVLSLFILQLSKENSVWMWLNFHICFLILVFFQFHSRLSWLLLNNKICVKPLDGYMCVIVWCTAFLYYYFCSYHHCSTLLLYLLVWSFCLNFKILELRKKVWLISTSSYSNVHVFLYHDWNSFVFFFFSQKC